MLSTWPGGITRTCLGQSWRRTHNKQNQKKQKKKKRMNGSTQRVTRFNGQHLDVIHCVAYDYYGNRIASCSADHRIKIWDRDDKDEFQCTANFKAHVGIYASN